MLSGRLIKYHANFYYVEVGNQLYECSLKGLLKKAIKGDNQGGDILVGDCVTLDNPDEVNHTARITDIQPRSNALTRPKIANVDQVLVVYSVQQPDFDFNQMDRYLTHIAMAGIPALICISKTDLDIDSTKLKQIQALYADTLGYPVYTTSVYTPESLLPIKNVLKEKITVLAGPSGAGKSSLLNVLKPALDLKVGEVSQKIERGQHTTRHVELLEIDANTYIADTPGFSQLRFDTIMPRTLAAVFLEFQNLESSCTFADCLHLPDSQGCSLLENASAISKSRYQSYLDMMAEAAEYREEAQKTSQKTDYGFKTTSNKGKKDLAILRLKGKQRQVGRNTQRQQLDQLADSSDED